VGYEYAFAKSLLHSLVSKALMQTKKQLDYLL